MEKDISQKFNAFTTKKGNIIWLGAISLAWNRFAKTYGQKHLEFTTDKPDALKMISN